MIIGHLYIRKMYPTQFTVNRVPFNLEVNDPVILLGFKRNVMLGLFNQKDENFVDLNFFSPKYSKTFWLKGTSESLWKDVDDT